MILLYFSYWMLFTMRSILGSGATLFVHGHHSVHPEYLRRVLLHFGFPSTLVTSLSKLFFGTRIHVSINGWLGSAFTQGRGLRQGDPLSPLLFNLAFEPMLRSISASTL